MRKASWLIAIVSWMAPSAAAADELSRNDRGAVLFSTQLEFDADNTPIVPIGIVDRKSELRLTTRGPVRLRTEDDAGAIVLLPANLGLRVWVEGGKPARLRPVLVVGRFASRDLGAQREAKARWEERGFVVRSIELGSVFGFYGRVFDSRVSLLCLDKAYKDEAAAGADADTLRHAYPDAHPELHTELYERPQGTVVLTDGRITVRNPALIRLVPVDNQPVRVEGVEQGRGHRWAHREDLDYGGEIVLAVDTEGTLAAVNMLSAEKVLEGIVPSEIYKTSPPEALKAQAVVARGELLAKLGFRHFADPFRICSDVHCQAYRGSTEAAASTTAAVRATRGEMLFVGDKLVDAVYSANCGGHTEAFHLVWGGEPLPALTGVQDGPRPDEALKTIEHAEVPAFLSDSPPSYCQKASKGAANFRWTKSWSASELDAHVARAAPVGQVLDLKVKKRGVSGRAIELELLGDKGTHTIEGELSIRRALGDLKSALFEVAIERDKGGVPARFVFRGGGFGHGAGLCQTGAIGAAESGLEYNAILQHYFSGAEVQRIY